MHSAMGLYRQNRLEDAERAHSESETEQYIML